ncbi:MAG: glycosyltransferase [Phycisphaeraceae bacterium]|nr:glycosyltransferase [Phycisphaeraceae bacterium]
MWFHITIAGLLAVPAVGAILWWGFALAAMNRTEAALGSAEDGIGIGVPHPPVIVVVPAHNEQSVIAGLISSLRGQDYPNFRVALALDRCTDNTLSVALDTINSDERFEIVEVSECPRDWAGKVHAIHSALVSRTLAPDQLLLFADADTVFDRTCIRSCVHLLEHRGLDALTLLSTLTFDRGFERRIQAPASMELLVRYPPRKASREHRRRPFANGQFILIRRSAYEAIGTHAAFREELLEDLAMARALWREKLKVHVIRAGRMLTCRMYPDPIAFERGWTRIFIEAAKRKPRRLRNWSIGTTVRGFLEPVGCLLGLAGSLVVLAQRLSPWPWLFAISAGVAILGLVVWAGAIHRFLVLGGVARWWKRVAILLWWPVGSLQLAALLRRAAANLRTGIPTGWAGKSYVRPAR